jgi:hypothetical protein
MVYPLNALSRLLEAPEPPESIYLEHFVEYFHAPPSFIGCEMGYGRITVSFFIFFIAVRKSNLREQELFDSNLNCRDGSWIFLQQYLAIFSFNWFTEKRRIVVEVLASAVNAKVALQNRKTGDGASESSFMQDIVPHEPCRVELVISRARYSLDLIL